MIAQMIKNVSTKAYEGADAVSTELTLDFTGLTDADVQEIAAGACVIKWQSKVRAGKGAIPTKDTYKVPKPGTRTASVRVYTNEELIEEMVKRGLIDQVLEKAEELAEKEDTD